MTEKRKYPRTNYLWNVSVWVPQHNRFYNGTLINISKGGCFITLDISLVVKMEIEVNFPRTVILKNYGGTSKGKYARIRLGKIVRVIENNFAMEFENE